MATGRLGPSISRDSPDLTPHLAATVVVPSHPQGYGAWNWHEQLNKRRIYLKLLASLNH